MDSLTGPAIAQLEAALRFREARQAVLAANVANLDTPGYRSVDLRFQDALGEAGVDLSRSHPEHLSGEAPGGGGYAVEIGPRGTRPDGNGVDPDRAVLELSRNAGEFGRQAEVLTRLLALARVAVSGEPR
jgi:flagellar basal-body rod protein FlgB